MPETQNTDSTSNSTVAQLLEIDSQLSTQQAQLRSQLESLQQKRQSLQVVINLFGETDKAQGAAPIEETISTPQAQTVDKSQAVLEPESQESLTATSPTDAAKTVKKPTSSPNKKSQTKKTRSKKTKPVVGWQFYLREEFRNSSFPQAIAQVIHNDAKQVWDTAMIADTIFVSEIPQ